MTRMSTRRASRGDVNAVAEQRRDLSLELGEVEVSTAILHRGHEFGWVAPQVDGADTVAGSKLAQEAGPLAHEPVVDGG